MANTYSPHALENVQDNTVVLVDILILIPVCASRSGIVANCGVPVHLLAIC